MSTGPHIRYYDARGPHRWMVLLGVLGLAGLGLVGLGPIGLGLVGTAGSSSGDPAQDEDASSLASPAAPVAVEPMLAPRATALEPMLDPAAPGRIGFASVVMVGDSITRGSRDALRLALTEAGVSDLIIDGEDSRRIEVGNGRSEPLAGVRAIEDHVAEQDERSEPGAWVVALGTNDVGLFDEPGEYRRLVRSVVDLIPVDAALLWVDVYRYDEPDATAMFNQIIRDELGTRDRSGVVSWFDIVTADESLLQQDRIHPDDNGRAAFARLVATGLASLSGS